MDEQAVREKLRTFIVTELIRDPGHSLGDGDAIISDGKVDSFSVAELGMYIEVEFGLSIPDPDLTVEKMDTLNLIVSRVMAG